MKKQVVSTNAPSAPAFLSQAVASDNTVYVSGQIHIDKDNNLIGKTTAQKLEQIMGNIKSILSEADANLDDIVKVVIYVTDMALMQELNKAYSTYFSEPYPVREAVCVKALPLGASIEISVIAEK